MFDIGFWELAIIGVVALLVIGPERLPALARTAGVWLGRGRRFMASVKADIDREIKADELKRIMKEQAESSGIHEILEETRETLDDTRDTLDKTRSELEAGERSSPETEDQPSGAHLTEHPPAEGEGQSSPPPATEPQPRKEVDER